MYVPSDKDPLVPADLVRNWQLREGLSLHGTARQNGSRGLQLVEISEINGKDADFYREVVPIAEQTVIDPFEQIRLETTSDLLSTRVLDLLTPVGKGQRGLLVAPPRTGKTVLLKQIAQAVTANHPEIKLMVLLVDERPEEVTDMKRSIEAEVAASSNDRDIASHVRVAQLTNARAVRMAEQGDDVLLLLDSLTRLGRAYNQWVKNSGRIMSGGVDIRALQIPKQIFGSARKLEHGGSLTILATALIDTGSRMDELIFQEFKGTGNMEIVLNRTLADQRIWPAMEVAQSGTRKEELLLSEENTRKVQLLRRHFQALKEGEQIPLLLKALGRCKTNADFLSQFGVKK